mmetsp:Transcript_16875/g.25529  ORF Transcript_16875/g.25529 Transcript_16875/m.25529 type:complete len:116 (+) Transcript_16875:51-398(+)|eukprot:CAMPEP_0178922572 /NCGR_PEP_ID=MMETSP0786-20121207/16234_1 /TAXON_ID=186022 /ORGANISM="Thalassionema frauenfeldii, Strain CCMP 1798" /LENGTH=115 /DNA_ID=CAMNT_0020596963 /DNA_START=50 /DNA_END=397 /DNA_ORIENTATION=+
MSDSSYIAVTNHRRPFDTSGRPPVLELIDDEWAADVLEEEDLPTKAYEIPLFEEDDLDGEPAVVTTGTSSSAVTNLEERRKRDEGWNDLGLDQLDQRTETIHTSNTHSVSGGSSQ